MSIKL